MITEGLSRTVVFTSIRIADKGKRSGPIHLSLSTVPKAAPCGNSFPKGRVRMWRSGPAWCCPKKSKPTSKKETESPEKIMIYNVISTMSDYMGLNIGPYIQDIIKSN